MKGGVKVRVLGTGVVWPQLGEESLISRPEVRRPVGRVREEGGAWERWKREPRMRRAAPIARFMAEAVGQALFGAAVKRRGLIGCFSLGGIVYSRRFYEGVLRQGRGLASPALFPETVYNSPLSHVAAVHKLDGPVYALVGDETCWVTACETALVWLESGLVDEVVVVAGDEVDAVVVEGYEAAGWFGKWPGWVVAEGAGAVRLGGGDGGGAKLAGVWGPLPWGKGFPGVRDRAEQMRAWVAGGAGVWRTGWGGAWSEAEAVLAAGREVVGAGEEGSGHSLSVSPAWSSCRVIEWLGRGGGGAVVQPVWGVSHGVGALWWEDGT